MPRPGYLPPAKRLTTHCTGGWTGEPRNRYGWIRQISHPPGVRTPGRTARIESLYLLRHSGRHELSLITQNCRVLEPGN